MLAPGVVADVVAFLGGTGAVLRADGAGRFAEDDDPARRQWSHHELTFAAFSRTRQPDGRGPHPGAEEPAAPVTRPEPSGARLPLYRPDLTAVAARDPVLTELLETDHRCPEFSGVDLTADAVGELLYRTARIRSVGPSYVPMAASYEASQRPYLNIACLYELELYLTVNRCDGLPRGTYHYDPLGHALTAVQDDPAVLTTLLDLAKVAAGSTRQPALLLTITARMGRVSWILPRSAYATTLMHVGALQQTLYLGAKAMGLSAHAVVVDAGNTVDRALRLDWPGETVVGECVVDRPP